VDFDGGISPGDSGQVMRSGPRSSGIACETEGKEAVAQLRGIVGGFDPQINVAGDTLRQQAMAFFKQIERGSFKENRACALRLQDGMNAGKGICMG
jgi:hypothetical protein